MVARDVRNPLCSCRKTGAWLTRDEAEDALERVRVAATDPGYDRMYHPVRVERCAKGVWHLTSRPGKPWKSRQSRRR